MKELALEDAVKDVDRLEADLRSGSVVLTRRGAPLALMLSLDRYDREDLEYMTSPDFWQMIEDRRREQTVPWEQVKREMFADASANDGKA